MFTIDCPSCQTTHLVSNAHVLSVHRTAEGLIAYVRCAAGHTVMQRVENRYAFPPPLDAGAMEEPPEGHVA